MVENIVPEEKDKKERPKYQLFELFAYIVFFRQFFSVAFFRIRRFRQGYAQVNISIHQCLLFEHLYDKFKTPDFVIFTKGFLATLQSKPLTKLIKTSEKVKMPKECLKNRFCGLSGQISFLFSVMNSFHHIFQWLDFTVAIFRHSLTQLQLSVKSLRSIEGSRISKPRL